MLPGRKAIEVAGDEQMLYKILAYSRLIEDVQVRAGP